MNLMHSKNIHLFVISIWTCWYKQHWLLQTKNWNLTSFGIVKCFGFSLELNFFSNLFFQVCTLLEILTPTSFESEELRQNYVNDRQEVAYQHLTSLLTYNEWLRNTDHKLNIWFFNDIIMDAYLLFSIH